MLDFRGEIDSLFHLHALLELNQHRVKTSGQFTDLILTGYRKHLTKIALGELECRAGHPFNRRCRLHCDYPNQQGYGGN